MSELLFPGSEVIGEEVEVRGVDAGDTVAAGVGLGKHGVAPCDLSIDWDMEAARFVGLVLSPRRKASWREYDDSGRWVAAMRNLQLRLAKHARESPAAARLPPETEEVCNDGWAASFLRAVLFEVTERSNDRQATMDIRKFLAGLRKNADRIMLEECDDAHVVVPDHAATCMFLQALLRVLAISPSISWSRPSSRTSRPRQSARGRRQSTNKSVEFDLEDAVILVPRGWADVESRVALEFILREGFRRFAVSLASDRHTLARAVIWDMLMRLRRRDDIGELVCSSELIAEFTAKLRAVAPTRELRSKAMSWLTSAVEDDCALPRLIGDPACACARAVCDEFDQSRWSLRLSFSEWLLSFMLPEP